MIFMKNIGRFAGLASAIGFATMAMAGPSGPQHKTPSKASIKQGLAATANRFTKNVGQWDSRALFLSRGKGHDVWITRDGATYDFYKRDLVSGQQKGDAVAMTMVGGNRNAEAVGLRAVSGHTDFLVGAKQGKGASRFEEVVRKGVYKGVDVRYYVEAGNPRYDFLVAPNVSPSQIRVKFAGAKSSVAKDGAIVLKTSQGSVSHGKLFAYQQAGLRRSKVSVRYVAMNDGTYGLKLGAYDKRQPLIIDPLVYGSYYGGDNGNDEVRTVVADADGGVYIGGRTVSARFPALAGPYGFQYKSGWDAFIAKLQGDAYANIYSAYIGGSLDEVISYLQVDPFGNVWSAGIYNSSDLPGNVRPNVQYLRSGGATGGTYRLNYGGFSTNEIRFNATPAQVQRELDRIPALTGKVRVTAVNASRGLPEGETFRVQLDITAPLIIGTEVTGRWRDFTNPSEAPFMEGLNAHYISLVDGNATVIRSQGSVASAGTYRITFTNGTNVDTTIPINFNARPLVVQAALNALTNLANGTFSVTGGDLPARDLRVQFTPQNGTAGAIEPRNFDINSTGMFPQPQITNAKATTFDIFVMRWAKDAVKVLDPGDGVPKTFLAFGGELNETLAGFAIKQVDNPTASTPVTIGFGGNTQGSFDPGAFATGGQSGAYMARFSFVNGGFVRDTAGTKYSEGTLAQTVGGFAMDLDGNGYLAGHVGSFNSDNTSTTFPVLNFFENGNKLRLRDLFVRKYSPKGVMLYSSLLGGNGVEVIGGLDVDPNGVAYNSGSAIAVDTTGNAYVTGVTTSFNYPRTRGVFGETFSAARVVVVTKISPDGRQIVYSTNLRTAGRVNPAGIAVDASGNAFVTGMLRPNFVDFPETNGQQTGDPNEPVTPAASSLSVQLKDPLDAVFDTNVPANPIFPTTEGFLNVLNNTGTQLIFGTYIGGNLDEVVYAPYVDRFGDVWVMGSTDFARAYVRVSSTGTVNDRSYYDGGLPDALISPLAFKASQDPVLNGVYNQLYGAYGDRDGNTWSPSTVRMAIARDGFLIKLRVGATPNVQDVTLTPSSVPGGLGAFSDGVVTLSSAAPSGDAEVIVAVDNSAVASFDATASVDTTVVRIPAGATTGNFRVFTRGVSANTAVGIKATYLGSFQVRQLNVVPWLQSFSLAPNDLVGGNQGTGRITLATAAPAGGITLDVSTDNTSLISVPGGNLVTVPAGQTSFAFAIDTKGVDRTTVTSVTASTAGVNRPATLTLRSAALLSLSFSPVEVAGLSKTTGTILLNGKAGAAGFKVDLSGLSSSYTMPTSVSFASGEGSKTFDVTTPLEGSTVTRRVTANRAATGGYLASTVTGTFSVVAATIKSISLSPTSVPSGGVSTATVELNSPAPQGGVVVNIGGDPNFVTVPKTVTIPAGTSVASFPVTAGLVTLNTQTEIRASRAALDLKSVFLTIEGAALALTLEPSSVLGGKQNSVGTVSVASAVGPQGLTVNLFSSATAAATVPATVKIAAGAKSATFPITTKTVTTTTPATIRASAGQASSSSILTVRSNGVNGITILPGTVQGGTRVNVTVTLDDLAKAGGQPVLLVTSNKALFTSFPSTITIPAGKLSQTFTLTTVKVSRNQAATITASVTTSSATATVNINR